MRVKLALLADFANVTREGKLNIIGKFDRIWFRDLPVRIASMHLIIEIEAYYAERGRPQRLTVTLDDPDGGRLLELPADVMVAGGTPGNPIGTGQILALNNLEFLKAGGYTFNIFINEHLAEQLTLQVVPRDPELDQPRLPGT